MVSVSKLIFFMFLFFITIAEGEKKKEKIVIHVPYKIHKHHHTHTKYKIITVPSPKKENTVIYLKEELQPVIKHVAPVQIHTEVLPTAKKNPQQFIPPHQESAPALLQALSAHKEQDLVQTSEQNNQYSTILEDQKPLETQTVETTNLVPSFAYNPIILPSQNVLPHYPFKPLVLPSQHDFMPNMLLNSGMHQYHTGFNPKFTYQPMVHIPKGYFNQKYPKPMQATKNTLNDNIAHSSSNVYKTIINPRQKIKPYKVKEETQESKTQFVNHQTSNIVPSLKSNRKGKMYFQPGHELKNIESMNPDFEYEHIGYLIIDGNTRKAVGKNFKDPLNLNI